MYLFSYSKDYQFLLINKFGYVVNCTSQIPNVFQHQNIKYLKFKLVEQKPHKLWNQSIKKLLKFSAFIQEAEQASLCCLVHSYRGNNRSLVFITAFLMHKFQWKLKKCFEYLRSKGVYIGLSNHYINQLQLLQQILSNKSVLSSSWAPPYIDPQQQLISKTFINSRQAKQEQFEQQKRVKKQKRVMWLDKIQKKKNKDLQLQKQKAQKQLKNKSSLGKNLSVQKIIQKIPYFNQKNHQRESKDENISKYKNYLDQEFTHKMKKSHDELNKDNKDEEQKVYKLTINNYINPNFNIISKSQPLVVKKEKKLRPTSANKKNSQKINRTVSQKQGVKERKALLNKQVKKVLKEQKQKHPKEKHKSQYNLNSIAQLQMKRNVGTTPTKNRVKKN